MKTVANISGATTARYGKFYNLKTHPVIGKLYSRLTKDEYDFCLNYILDNDCNSDAVFIFNTNRLFVDDPNKPPHWKDIADIMSNVVIPTPRPRRI